MGDISERWKYIDNILKFSSQNHWPSFNQTSLVKGIQVWSNEWSHTFLRGDKSEIISLSHES